MKLRAWMTGGCLATGLLTPAFSAPPPETWFSSCEGPIATCDQPRPISVAESLRAAGIIHPETPARSDDAHLRLPPPETSSPDFKTPEIEPSEGLQPIPEERFQEARAALMQWQAATKSRFPTTDAERLRLASELSDASAFERRIAAELRGPIDAEALWKRFEWRVADGDGSLLLIAEPRDVLDRLLCPRFEIRFDEGLRAVTLAFPGDHAMDWRWVVLNEAEHTVAKITPASYESDSAEPARLRTAAIEEAVELKAVSTRTGPRLAREADGLSLPRAPMDDVVR